MKQEHEMTPGVLVSGEVLSAGDARARVAVLEAELAELRQRVCVPEGYVVVPIDPSAAHLDSMAMRIRHDFGLLPEYLKARFRSDARQLYEECTGQGFYKLAAAPAPVERVEQEAVSYYERAHGEKSPTHGMNLGERIAHVGGRTNAAGYMEFGSVMAVSALIDHVLRDSPAPQPAPTAAQDVAGLVTALRTVVGMLHHKATTPLERESIKIAEAAIAAHQQREGE